MSTPACCTLRIQSALEGACLRQNNLQQSRWVALKDSTTCGLSPEEWFCGPAMLCALDSHLLSCSPEAGNAAGRGISMCLLTLSVTSEQGMTLQRASLKTATAGPDQGSVRTHERAAVSADKQGYELVLLQWFCS